MQPQGGPGGPPVAWPFPGCLPTEAEWEYACRAGTRTRYYSGDSEEDLKRVAWYKGNSDRATHPVGQKEANAFGLYDMLGNVWQRCQDWYGDYPAEAVADPRGPAAGEWSTLRGGSAFDYPGDCRSACRGTSGPGSVRRPSMFDRCGAGNRWTTTVATSLSISCPAVRCHSRPAVGSLRYPSTCGIRPGLR
jgi:hypothetical protein